MPTPQGECSGALPRVPVLPQLRPPPCCARSPLLFTGAWRTCWRTQVLGRDFAGVVAEADAGSTLPPGTRVWGFTDWSMRRVRSARSGAYAECVCAPEAQVAPLPSSLGFGQAAALALVSLTAWQVWWPAGWGFRMLLISISCLAASGQRWHKWAPAAVGEAVPQTCNQPIHTQPAVSLVNLSSCLQALDAAGLQRGQRVRIHAGAGGVGSVTIQLAKARGLHVTTTCSTQNLDFVREVGGVHGGQGWAAACCHHPSPAGCSNGLLPAWPPAPSSSAARV